MNDMKRKNPNYDFYSLAPFLNTMKDYLDMYYDKLIDQFVKIVLQDGAVGTFKNIPISTVTFYN